MGRSVCVDVPSATEAVLGEPMKLTCIACLMREEIKARTRVDWYYMPEKEQDVPPNKTHVGSSCAAARLLPVRSLRVSHTPVSAFQIYRFEDHSLTEMEGPFKGRLFWNGSQDLQDLSIRILNVTYNDSGVYECHVFRRFEFNFFTPSVLITKDIKLRVKEKGATGPFSFFFSFLFSSLKSCLPPFCLSAFAASVSSTSSSLVNPVPLHNCP